MRIEAPWICGGCEHANAGYRRRCQRCGQRRPAEADRPPGPSLPAGAVAEEQPPIARWKLAVLAAGVAGGVFGVVTYVSADRPTRADDRRALEAALLAPGELGSEQIEASREVSSDDRSVGILAGLVDQCPVLVEEEEALLAKHGTAQIRQHLSVPDGTDVVTYLAAFDTPVAAQNHRDQVESEEVSACEFGEDGADRVVGRWWIHLVVTGAADDTQERALIDRIVDRVEIEG